MATIKNIIDILDQWAPPAYAEDFDNVGLLIGEAKNECSGILVSLDCIEKVVDEAIESKCNLIICFHPIVFSGLKKITGKDYICLLYTSPSPRDRTRSRMPSSA